MNKCMRSDYSYKTWYTPLLYTTVEKVTELLDRICFHAVLLLYVQYNMILDTLTNKVEVYF